MLIGLFWMDMLCETGLYLSVANSLGVADEIILRKPSIH
jgi:hypothetical protein